MTRRHRDHQLELATLPAAQVAQLAVNLAAGLLAVGLPGALLEGEVRLAGVPHPHHLAVGEGGHARVTAATLAVPLTEEEGDGSTERMERELGHGSAC